MSRLQQACVLPCRSCPERDPAGSSRAGQAHGVADDLQVTLRVNRPRFFRDALVYKETARASMVINADLLPVVSALAFGLRGEQILQNMALVEKSAEYVDMNVNKSLTLEAMAFKLHL